MWKLLMRAAVLTAWGSVSWMLSADDGIDRLTGSDAATDCKDCKDKLSKAYQCYYPIAFPNTPCSEDACVERTVQFVTCVPRASATANCKFKLRREYLRELWVIKKKGGLNCGDVDQRLKAFEGDPPLPPKSDCVTYPDGEFKGKCFLRQACGDVMILGTKEVKGLHVCE